MSKQSEMSKDNGLYKMHRLPKDPEKGIEAAKHILISKVNVKPVQAKLRYKVEGRIYNTNIIYMRTQDPEKVELLRSDLLRNFSSFEEIVLLTSPLKRRRATCPNCSKIMHSNHLPRHLKACIKSQKCPVCQKAVSGILGEHIEKCNVKTYSCNVCREEFNTAARKAAHEKKCGVAEVGESALNGLFRMVELKPNTVSPDYEGVLEDEVKHIAETLEDRLDPALKFYISLELSMRLPTDDKEKTVSFQTKSTALLQAMRIEKEIGKHIKDIVKDVEKYIRNGSGWVVENVKTIYLMMTKYSPGGGTFISLPKEIKNKKSLLNVRNNDNKCLLWSLLAALNPVGIHRSQVFSYKRFEDSLNMTGVEYPVSIHQLKKVEKQNNLAIYVYGWEKDEGFFPLRSSKSSGKPIHLLLLANDHTQHYVVIKSLSGLLSKRTKHNGLSFYCDRCLHGFSKQENLGKHSELCRNFKVQRTEMPSYKYMEFKGFGKMIKMPIFIAADFESFIKEIDPGTGNTKKTARHEACAYALKVSSHFEEFDWPVEYYRGENAAQTFILRLHEIYEELKPLLESDEKIKLPTPEQEHQLKNQKDCYLCNKPLPKDRKYKHLDHCHYTGDIIAYAHPVCNQQRKLPKKIPVVIHNFKGYDSHLLIRDLCAAEDDLNSVSLIPKNMEQYTSIRTDKFVFLDSCQHLAASLDTLTENLKMEGEGKFQSVKQYIDQEHSGSTQKFNLMLRKGVYPYTYMDSHKKFEEGLPPINCFFNDLKNEPCSTEDYQHAQNMWREFNMQNLGDLCDIYVQSDCLLLVDIINEYRRECWDNFHLEPLHYDTAPGLTWDAALRWTGVRLELLQDIDMYQFCESGIRGGVSVISKRRVVCNNKDLPYFDPTKPSNYIWYGDANNLYGGSMVEKLPISDFTWTTLTKQQIQEYDPESETGYLVECDLSFPNEVHDKFNCFPIAAEPLEITQNVASPKSLEIRSKRHQETIVEETSPDPKPKRAKIEQKFSCIKLAPNLLPKSKYICHIRNLQFYLEEGAHLDGIHRVLKFKQEAWLKPYIDYNTRKRQEATTDFKKTFHKLLNNAVFGKTMESVRRRVNVVLINKARQHKYQTSKPGFKRFSIFDEDLVGVELVKPVVKLDKPVYVGATVLELSKLTMVNFYYRIFKPRFPGAELCFTDTDSLLVDIPTDDLYRDLSDLKEHLDLSNYPRNHPLYDPSNKAVLNKFKDECAGHVVKEFIGLRSKCYSILIQENEEEKQKSTAAGVKKCVKKSIHHDHYRSTLESESDYYVTQNLLRSYKHTIFSVNQKKIALTAYDDKRYLLNDSIHTRAYGHYLNR